MPLRRSDHGHGRRQARDSDDAMFPRDYSDGGNAPSACRAALFTARFFAGPFAVFVAAFFALFFTALFFTALFFTALFFTALFFTAFFTALFAVFFAPFVAADTLPLTLGAAAATR